jgi:hypothetical protein
MRSISIDLSNAVQAFAAANTPLYLLKKLRSDPGVHHVSRSFESNEIIHALKGALRVKPKTFKQAVFPYVLLLALANQGDLARLRETEKIAAPAFKWFGYLRDVLIQQFRPASRQTLSIEQSTIPQASIATTLPARVLVRS